MKRNEDYDVISSIDDLSLMVKIRYGQNMVMMDELVLQSPLFKITGAVKDVSGSFNGSFTVYNYKEMIDFFYNHVVHIAANNAQRSANLKVYHYLQSKILPQLKLNDIDCSGRDDLCMRVKIANNMLYINDINTFDWFKES
jgi:hypothetical protein